MTVSLLSPLGFDLAQPGALPLRAGSGLDLSRPQSCPVLTVSDLLCHLQASNSNQQPEQAVAVLPCNPAVHQIVPRQQASILSHVFLSLSCRCAAIQRGLKRKDTLTWNELHGILACY